MSDQKNAEEEINLVSSSIRKKMKKWQDQFATDPKRAKKNMTSELNNLKAIIDNYNLQYVEGTKNAKSQKKFLDFTKELKEIEGEIKEFLIRNTDKEDKPQGLREPKRKGNKQELLQLGDKYQKDGLERLTGMNKELNDGHQMVVDGNVELERQNEKLMQADEHLLDMGTALKRSQEYVKYFSKSLYEDKFVRIMTILIMLAFVTIVIIAFIKKRGVATATTATTSTNTTTATL